MSRLKKTSPGVMKALQRLTGLIAISPTLDLGQGFNVPAIQNQINDARARVETYNRLLSQVDALQNDVLADDRKMRDLAARILSAVAVRYGRDSNEFEMVGGTRLSEQHNHNGNGTKPNPENGQIQQPVLTATH